MPKREPSTLPGKPTNPPAGEPDVPSTPQDTAKKEVAPTHEFPSWMEIHPPHPVTQLGESPQV